MLIRALSILLLLCVSPVTTWATTVCCYEEDECCGEEQPSCPVLPDGSCSIAAAGQAVATISPTTEPLSLLAVTTFELTAATPLRVNSLACSVPNPDPPRFLVFQPLRN